MPNTENTTGNRVPGSNFEYTREIGDRIKSVVALVGGPIRAAELAGVSNDTIANWRDGRAKPSFFGLASLAIAAGKSLDWMLLGDASALTDERVPESATFHDGDDRRDFTLVPRVGVTASAGYGLAALTEEITERLAFKTEWLRDMGVSPAFAGLLTARGDSMLPVIPDGSLLLVDMNPDQVIRSGCYYVLVLDGDVLVKLVNRRVDGTIELISINPDYPKETINSQDLDKLTIPGRVVWIGHKL